MDHHHKESHRIGGQRHGGFYSHVSNLLFLGHRCVAFVLHSFIFWLQFTPASALFGTTHRPHIPKRTYECGVCGALYRFNGYTFVLAVGPTRPCVGKRACPSIALPNDFWKHSTWTSSAEENHD